MNTIATAITADAFSRLPFVKPLIARILIDHDVERRGGWDIREVQITSWVFSGFHDCDTNTFLMELESQQEWPHRASNERVAQRHQPAAYQDFAGKLRYLREQYEKWADSVPDFLCDETIVAVSRNKGRLTIVPPTDPLVVTQMSRLANYVWQVMPCEYCQSTLSDAFSQVMKKPAPPV